MKKIMVGLALLGALAWIAMTATYSGSSSYVSYTYLASGTADSTVVITGKPAGNISIFNSGSNIMSVSWNNNGAGAGSVPPGSSMTWNGVEIYQYTLDRTNATEVYAWTW